MAWAAAPEEVGLVGPGRATAADQTQVSLMHQGGGLHELPGRLRAQEVMSELVQLLVDLGHQGLRLFPPLRQGRRRAALCRCP